jgi:hypothetical protein
VALIIAIVVLDPEGELITNANKRTAEYELYLPSLNLSKLRKVPGLRLQPLMQEGLSWAFSRLASG